MIEPELARPRGRGWRLWLAATVVLLVVAAVLLTGGLRGTDEVESTRAADQQGAPEAPGSGTAGAAPAPAPAPEGAAEGPAAGPAAGAPGDAPGGAAGGAPPADPAAGGGGAVAQPPAPGGGPAAAPPAGAPPEVRSAGPSVPLRLRIPALALSTPLSGLGLEPDNTVEVPTDFQQAGWFDRGPTPGEWGSAVILGHVDSYRGPAVFFRLRSLKAGDDVEVTREDGSVARFAVTSVATYPKEQFPAERVYAPQGGSVLNLVTCGGEFDQRSRSYRSNIVVYTSLVAVSPA